MRKMAAMSSSVETGRGHNTVPQTGKSNGPIGMVTFPPAGNDSVHNGQSTVAMATASMLVNQSHSGHGHAGKASRDGTVATVIERLDSTSQDKEDEEIIVDEAEEPSRSAMRGLHLAGSDGDKRIRMKKQKDLHGSEVVGGGGDGGKNDSYCWVCHEGGEVLCCDKCPRVFHFRCTKLDQEPEGEEWYCSVCTGLARSKRIKKTKPDDLQECLQKAVCRLMFPGTDLFQTDVSDDLKEEYRQNVFYPMHLGIIRERVSHGGYSTTREFLADTEWILHNCIIFNGAKCELTKVAKNIVRTCVNDMKEIELAPCCFKNIASRKEWFDLPCNPPHPVVLAKVNRYPTWPAKLINSGTEKCDVRFFGAHDRGIVPCSSIQPFTGVLPTPPSLTGSKVKEWNMAVAELKQYLENVRRSAGPAAANFPITVTTELPRGPSAPVKEVGPKPTTAAAGSQLGVPGHAPSPGGSLVNGQEGEPRLLDGAMPKSLVLDSDSGSESHTQDSDVEDKDGEYTPRLDAGPPTKKGRVSIPRKPLRGTASQPARGSLTVTARTYPTPGVQAGVHTETSGVSVTPKGVVGGGRVPGVVAQGNGTASPRPRPPAGSRKRSAVQGSEAGAGSKGKRDRQRSLTVPATTASAQLPTTQLPTTQLPTTQLSTTQLPTAQLASGQLPTTQLPTAAQAALQQLLLQAQKSVHPVSVATTKATPLSAPPPTVLSAGPPVTASPSTANPISNPALSVPQPQKLSDQIKEVFKIDSHPSLKTDDKREVEFKPLPPSPPPPTQSSGGGILNDTIATVSRAINAQHSLLAGPTNDMGFTHYAERLMGTVQLVLLDMLADFHKKGQSSAKELGEGLLGAWPISPSQRSLQELRRELRAEMHQRVEQIKTAAVLECEAKLAESRKELEQSKASEIELAVSRAIAETKKKHWCAYCSKEAQHYCCWNADYCSEECQNSHWQEHQKMCLNPQVVGVQPTSATPSDVAVVLPARAGIPPTPNLMSPTHDSRAQAFSFSQQTVGQGGGGGSGATGHTLSQAITTDVQSVLQGGVVMTTTVPTSQSSVAHMATTGRPAVSMPISPGHHHSSSTASHHGNMSSASSSGSSSLTSHSEQNHQSVHTTGHSSEAHSAAARAPHSVEVAQATPLATPHQSIFWPYQQVQGPSRYPPGFAPHVMVPTLYPSTEQANVIYQQQLLAEQQGGAAGGGAGQH